MNYKILSGQGIHNSVLVLFFCSNIFHFFYFLKLFSFTFYFPWLKFSMCLPQKITSRYTIVWFVWGVHYCVQLLSWGHDWFFFQSFPLPFPLPFFSFNYFITFLVSFIWNSQKCPVSQNIWCLIKTQLKNITQTIFQGGSPWATLIHNSVVCLRVHYCVQLLSWGHDFFSIISFTFSFASESVFLSINFFLSFFHLKFPEMTSFLKYMMPY